MHNQSRHGAAAFVDRPAPAPRRKLGLAKPKRWNHQDELEAMRDKRVKIIFTTGESGEYRLLEADQFAIKVEMSGVSLILWKHDLSSIQLLGA